MAKTNGCHDYGLKDSEVKVVYEKIDISMLSIPSLLNVAGKRISNWFDHDDQCIKLHQTFFYNGFEIERFGRHHRQTSCAHVVTLVRKSRCVVANKQEAVTCQISRQCARMNMHREKTLQSMKQFIIIGGL